MVSPMSSSAPLVPVSTMLHGFDSSDLEEQSTTDEEELLTDDEDDAIDDDEATSCSCARRAAHATNSVRGCKWSHVLPLLLVVILAGIAFVQLRDLSSAVAALTRDRAAATAAPLTVDAALIPSSASSAIVVPGETDAAAAVTLSSESSDLVRRLSTLLRGLERQTPSSSPAATSTSATPTPTTSTAVEVAVKATRPRALVVYIFSNNDPHYFGNLEFFIKTAVRAHQEIDYAFVLNQGFEAPAGEPEWNPKSDPWRNAYVARKYLPELPPNAFYVDHPNECFDLGSVGWFLSVADYARSLRENGGAAPNGVAQPAHWTPERYGHVKTDTRAYGYFFLLNASVRGPVLPHYFDLDSTDIYWYYPFQRMMEVDPEMKLVGCTASCRFSPHIQSYALFTDAVGLGILRSGPSLNCPNDMNSAIFDGEIGTSWQILQAGYNIGSMIPAQQNVEWRGSSGLHSQHCDTGADAGDASFVPTYSAYDLVFHKHQSRRPVAHDADEHVKWANEIESRRAQLKSHLGTMKAVAQNDRDEWNRRMAGNKQRGA